MEKFYYNSPIGILEVCSDNSAIVSLKITTEFKKNTILSEFFSKIKSQLDEYFSGKRKIFDIKINPKGTDFQKKVWKELSKIPYGQVKSYGDIAAKIGNTNAQRAVGSACNKNPIIIIIPCHRVISKNGKISGYAYGTGIKEKLLKLEKCTGFNTPKRQ